MPPFSYMPKFTKKEKLCSQKDIELLFKEGKVLNIFPFKVKYIVTSVKDKQYPAQIAFMVSKKLYKKAVDRNLIKRRLREAYRLNKEMLYKYLQEKDLYLTISIIYIDKEIQSFEFLQERIIKAINQLEKNFKLSNFK